MGRFAARAEAKWSQEREAKMQNIRLTVNTNSLHFYKMESGTVFEIALTKARCHMETRFQTAPPGGGGKRVEAGKPHGSQY